MPSGDAFSPKKSEKINIENLDDGRRPGGGLP